MELEICSACGVPTGHAGKDEDSLYIQPDWTGLVKWPMGPFCDSCYEDAINVLNDEILRRSE